MKRVLLVAFLLLATAAHAAPTLRVISAGPVGEVATLAEANEVRVVFSEPMVVIGQIREGEVPRYFRIEPPVRGAFRWSGTTTLIFTPDPALPYATRFDVNIDQSARSVAGNTLDQTYRFSFTTPTIRLMNVSWYRKPNRSFVMALNFNQPVDAQTIVQHLRLRTVPHQFEEPTIPESGIAELKKREPQALEAFERKKILAAQAAATEGLAILAFLAESWDEQKLGPPRPDKVVLETKPGILPETDVNIILDEKLAHAGKVPVGKLQEYRVELERALFVKDIYCYEACDPERYNAIRFRTKRGLALSEVRKALTLTDITDPAREVVVKPQLRAGREEYDYATEQFSFDALGYSLQPARRYLVRVDPSLATDDGQTLGYTWMGAIDEWHLSAFISFGSGEGVWESDGGSILPFHARNLKDVKQWLAPLSIEQTMPRLIELRNRAFAMAPATPPRNRKLSRIADKIQSFGLDIKPAVGEDNKGLLWAATLPGEPIEKSRVEDPNVRATIVQATNLGISVKDSPQNTVVMVTRLDNGQPVAGANVSIRDRKNKIVSSGLTDEQGVVDLQAGRLRTWTPPKGRDPNVQIDEWEYTWHALEDLHFIVVAEKDGDVAYVGSDWNEGLSPWEFGVNFNINEADPLLRGTIFTDRGVYKLGEEIHFKVILRSDTPSGMQLLPAGTPIEVILRDSQSKEVDKRTLKLNEWSSSEWTFKLPNEAPLGQYSVSASVSGQRLEIGGGFLVAAYRRPDFRVDVTLTAKTLIAGTELDGRIVARYLYGGAMRNQPVTWTYATIPILDPPQAIRDKFSELYSFLGWDWEKGNPSWSTIESNQETLDDKGELAPELKTNLTDGWPHEYRLEGDVTDVTRQTIANRTSINIHPAPWYIGLKTPPYFVDSTKGLDTEVIAASIDGLTAAGVPVHVELTRIQWNSVRQAVGNGFYEWHTERKEIKSGTWDITTRSEPVPLHVPLAAGGYYKLEATAKDEDGRSTTTRA